MLGFRIGHIKRREFQKKGVLLPIANPNSRFPAVKTNEKELFLLGTPQVFIGF